MFGKFPDQKVSKAMTSFPVYYWSQLTQIPNGFLTRPVLKISICFEPCFQIMDCAILPDRRKRREHCQVSCAEALVWYDGLHEVHQWQLEDAGFFTRSSTAGGECKHCNLSCKSHMTGIAWAPHGKQSLAFIHRLSHPNFTYCFILTAEEVKNVPTSFPFGHLTLHRYLKIHRPSVCIPLCFVLRFPLCLGFGLCFRSFACFCSDTWVKSLHWDTI